MYTEKCKGCKHLYIQHCGFSWEVTRLLCARAQFAPVDSHEVDRTKVWECPAYEPGVPYESCPHGFAMLDCVGCLALCASHYGGRKPVV
jgi:hypothetical protein